MSFIAELRSKRVLIVGAGTTGKSLANYLQTLGVEFSIIDERVEPFDGLEVLSEIPDAIDFDLALVSPGWRKDHNFGYFKISGGKRVFKMAPLQHHFELLGWGEVTIVIRFWILAGMSVAGGLGLFYGQWVVSQ